MRSTMPSHSSPGGSTFWRSLQTLNISRVVVAIALLTYLSLKTGKEFWFVEHSWFRIAAIAYLLISIGFVLLKLSYRKHFLPQLTAQVALDVTIISIMYFASGGSKSGLAILYLFPLAGIGILAPILLALFFAAAVTLFLLLDGVYHVLSMDDSMPISQAGFYGIAYFSVVYLLNRLAGNLIRQEELAVQRGRELAVAQAVNRIVIADMRDGILVVDQHEQVFEINPAAEHMLGIDLARSVKTADARLGNIAALQPIAEALAVRRNRPDQMQQTHGGNTTMWLMNEDASFVSIRKIDDRLSETYSRDNQPRAERPDFVTHLKLRFVMVDSKELTALHHDKSAYTIIFMQNVSDIENQAQQLKLASMGRLTASIAHEVRNPLSSISYAASLLSEDIFNETQSRRLLKIVDDNVGRLNQLIEDILKLSRKAQTDIQPFFLMAEVRAIVHDFMETRELPENLILIEDSAAFLVVFDPLHLREVVVNLLSNAVRYASGETGSIRLYAKVGMANRHELHIQDDGPGISSEVRSHLFEPFYTTSSKGTGLGLYMARELCLNNHALLDYEYRNDEMHRTTTESTGRFVINFSLPGQL
ncbi:PAS domain-containing protein [Undibacterium piscinae]|uniref:histidine kinase n=1 Tax=Undibacterium piscinae TaxID=2495591 RepID=A0A6M4A6V3_9BURK|nr:PAS domain-containing protein [Undibacterium piscinae]